MKPYNSYSYLYPPRPEVKITPNNLERFDDNTFLAQPKYNGSCAVLFLNSETYLYPPRPGVKITGEMVIKNRHNQPFSKGKIKLSEMDLMKAHRGKGWLVLCGELLNKNQAGEKGSFNHKFIIWDILVLNSEYLLGTTFAQRMDLLDTLYPTKQHELAHVLNIGIKGVYKAPVYKKDFQALYNDISKVSLYEGLVLKRAEGKLGLGLNSKNNTGWQVKCRKATANYSF